MFSGICFFIIFSILACWRKYWTATPNSRSTAWFSRTIYSGVVLTAITYHNFYSEMSRHRDIKFVVGYKFRETGASLPNLSSAVWAVDRVIADLHSAVGAIQAWSWCRRRCRRRIVKKGIYSWFGFE
jgi:hypothetical protein